MERVERNKIVRRSFLKISAGVAGLAILAACGAPAAAPTNAPAATVAPADTVAPATTAAQPTAATAATDTVAPVAATDTSVPSAASESQTSAGGQTAVFKIDPSQSEASFTLNEVLMGNPNTVVGKTTKISGVISASLDNPANTKIGAIQIDATGFQTNSGMRDRMIQRFILQSQQSQYQFITFEPTGIDGLPSKAATGTPMPVKITGNLKIRDVVKPVTFDATITMKSDTEVDGTAKTTVTRSAFGITIPNIPTVANVTDNVALQFDFVATKQ